MKRFVMTAGCVLAGVATASPARADIYADDLGKCLVSKATAADQTTLVRWIFSAMAAHPEVRSLSTITDAQRAGFNKGFADLSSRLLFVDCRPQAVQALKYEGGSSIEVSFRLLGQVAMRGLMSDPTVVAQLGQLDTMIDKSRYIALLKEAGLQPPPAK